MGPARLALVTDEFDPKIGATTPGSFLTAYLHRARMYEAIWIDSMVTIKSSLNRRKSLRQARNTIDTVFKIQKTLVLR